MSRSHLLNSKGFNELAEAAEGYYLYNRNDIYVGQAIEKYGEFSRLEMDLLQQLCFPGEVVIEVGANIGAHTLGLARRVGPRGRVLAFEPQRLVFQTLCANVAINSLENVDCFWAALGKEEGLIIVPELDPNMRSNFGGLSLSGATQGRSVPCHTLDGFLNLPGLRLLKIDVEGMEADVISGGRRLIEKFRPFLYVENDRRDRSEALMNLVHGLGYRIFWHLPKLFNPDNFYGDREDIYPNTVSVNILCVHRETPINMKGLVETTEFTKHPLDA